MDTNPDKTAPAAEPVATRAPWAAPVIQELGSMTDLTLQCSAGGPCGGEDDPPFGFIPPFTPLA